MGTLTLTYETSASLLHTFPDRYNANLYDIETYVNNISGFSGSGPSSSEQVTFDNSTSNIASANLQDVIEEIISNYVTEGQQECNIDQKHYVIEYGKELPNEPHPTVSLVLPSSADSIYVQGIYDVTSEDFKVVLSESPAISGYKINWMVKGI
jgi:hypothetical protein